MTQEEIRNLSNHGIARALEDEAKILILGFYPCEPIELGDLLNRAAELIITLAEQLENR